MIALYHPPYSAKKKITENVFLDELSEFLADVLVAHTNVVALMYTMMRQRMQWRQIYGN